MELLQSCTKPLSCLSIHKSPMYCFRLKGLTVLPHDIDSKVNKYMNSTEKNHYKLKYEYNVLCQYMCQFILTVYSISICYILQINFMSILFDKMHHWPTAERVNGTGERVDRPFTIYQFLTWTNRCGRIKDLKGSVTCDSSSWSYVIQDTFLNPIKVIINCMPDMRTSQNRSITFYMAVSLCFNSLSYVRFKIHFRKVGFKLILLIDGWGVSCEIDCYWTILVISWHWFK